MPYIGNSPKNNVRGRFYYTATAAQTVFSGADSNGKTLAYQDGGYVDVYLNGVLLQDTTDYTATTKTSVTLTSGATAGDLVEIVAYGIFSVADSVSALSGGTFEGAVVVNNNFTVDNGTIKLDGNYPVGSSNVAIGDTALDDASFSGANNVAVGHAAMSSTTSGNFNSGVGAYSLNSNTTGSSNSSYGSSSLENNTTGSSNSAYGAGALNSNTTASNNTAVGYQAGYNNTTGGNLVATGYQALYSNTTGNDNNAFGWQALYANTTGSNNTSLGFRSLYSNTTANSNTAVGYQALYATTGASNVSVGYASGDANTTGYENVFLGTAAGSANTTGIRNLYVGNNAGEIATTGSNNTYVGANGTAGSCGGVMTTGSRNTILGGYTGNQGGVDIRTSSNNIVLSDGDGNPRITANSTGDLSLGALSTGSASQTGVQLGADGWAILIRNNDPSLFVGRKSSDGDLVRFYQDTIIEGTISVSGTTVSYNGGHLSRWSQTTDNTRIDLVKGTVMTNLDQMAVWGDEDNEQLNCMAVSSVEGDPNVAGVFVNWDDDDEDYTNDMNIAMTGDMIIRIAQGTTVQRGDLLMSAGDGTAKPQGDDIVRSKTIAKVTSTHVTCTYDDGSYCVPCVLMAC